MTDPLVPSPDYKVSSTRLGELDHSLHRPWLALHDGDAADLSESRLSRRLEAPESSSSTQEAGRTPHEPLLALNLVDCDKNSLHLNPDDPDCVDLVSSSPERSLLEPKRVVH